MFTGIVTGLGKILHIEEKGEGKHLSIETEPHYLKHSSIGDSIAINGICSTITAIEDALFTCDYLKETLNVTTAASFKAGDSLNLELSATLKTYFGGHMVSGHVDTVARVLSFEKKGDWGQLKIACPDTDSDYLIHKGSIAIDGISLTISKLEDTTVSVELIPHTLEKTTLLTKKKGSTVNIEYDMLGKYIAKILKGRLH